MSKTFLALLLALTLMSCKNENANKDTQPKDQTKKTPPPDSQITKTTEPKVVVNFDQDNYGSYVDSGYNDRSKGGDWVSVTVSPLSDSKAMVSVRSRADKMQPACTFDALADIDGANSLTAKLMLGKMKFNFENNSVTISAGEGSQSSLLTYYCRGASLSGTYQKIDKALDKKQIDDRAYVNTLSLNGSDIKFLIEATGNKLTIAPSGLKLNNYPKVETIDGMITHAEVADLDANGYPEIFVFVTSPGSGSYGSLIGYVANHGKVLTSISLPDLQSNPEAAKGYMGHDQFAIDGKYLVRKFPVYKEGDANANPTGGTREILYTIEPGEVSWQLVPVKISTY